MAPISKYAVLVQVALLTSVTASSACTLLKSRPLPNGGSVDCRDVQSLLEAKCVRCHSDPPGLGSPSNMRLDRFDDHGGALGVVSLATLIVQQAEEGLMPPVTAPEAPLTDSEVELLRRWVQRGAPHATCIEAPTDAGDTDFDGSDGIPQDTAMPSDTDDADLALDTSFDIPDTAPPPPTTDAVFDAVFVPSCGSHHMDGSHAPLLTRDGLDERLRLASTQLPSMPYVTPGHPEQSYLFHKVTGTHLEVGGTGLQMPASVSPLDAEQLALVEDWIRGLEF